MENSKEKQSSNITEATQDDWIDFWENEIYTPKHNPKEKIKFITNSEMAC